MDSPDHQQLEQFIDRTLRELPLRRAPAELPSRVLAAIDSTARQGWWRKSFVHWPLSARVAFFGLSTVLTVIAINGSRWFLDAVAQPPFRPAPTSLSVVLKALLELQAMLLAGIPSLWMYAALAVIGAMYAMVFGIGTCAYRTLYAGR